MGDQTGPCRGAGREFFAAVPDLARIADDLDITLRPAILKDHSDNLAKAGWMIAKALRFLVAAGRAETGPDMDEALAEADVGLLAASGHVRDARAAATPAEQLAAVAGTSRDADLDLGDPIAVGGTIRILRPDTGTDPAIDNLQVNLDAADGILRWSSGLYGQLPIDGRAQLDLTATLDGIAAAYSRTVRRPACTRQEEPGHDK